LGCQLPEEEYVNLNPKTFKTLEFLLLVLSNLAGWLLALADYMPDRWAIYATAGSGALYALWRGIAKQNTDVKDYWHTSEFYVSIITSLPAVIGAFADTLDARSYGIIQAGIVAFLGIANGLRKDPMVATGAVPVVAITGMSDEVDLPDVPTGDGDDKAANAATDPALGDDPAFKDS
jgi:hypothetical protein